MFLRSTSVIGQTSADNRRVCRMGCAGAVFASKVKAVIRQGNCFVRFPSQNETPSFGGQQAGPSATLPVLFGLFARQGRERNSRPCVGTVNNIKKGFMPWAFRNLFSRLQRLQALRPAVTHWAIRLLVAQPSAQAPLLSPMAASRKVPHWAQVQTSLRVKLIWSTATDISLGLRPVTNNTAIPAQAFSLRGFCRLTNLFHHQKGQAYVQ